MIILLFLGYVGFLSSGANQKPVNQLNLSRYNLYSLKETYSSEFFLRENTINEKYSKTTGFNTNTLKQWGIYTGEFIAGGAPSIVYNAILLVNMVTEEKFFEKEYFSKYTIFNSILPCGMVIITGNLFNQKGSWWKSFIGSAIGSFAGWGVLYWNWYYGGDNLMLYGMYFVLPPLFATIGYNL